MLFIYPNICDMKSSPSSRLNDLSFHCACEYTNQLITFCWPQHLHLKSQSRWPLHPLDAVCPCSSLALPAQVVRDFPEIPLRLNSVGHRSKAGASWGASRIVEGIWRPHRQTSGLPEGLFIRSQESVWGPARVPRRNTPESWRRSWKKMPTETPGPLNFCC